MEQDFDEQLTIEDAIVGAQRGAKHARSPHYSNPFRAESNNITPRLDMDLAADAVNSGDYKSKSNARDLNLFEKAYLELDTTNEEEFDMWYEQLTTKQDSASSKNASPDSSTKNPFKNLPIAAGTGKPNGLEENPSVVLNDTSSKQNCASALLSDGQEKPKGTPREPIKFPMNTQQSYSRGYKRKYKNRSKNLRKNPRESVNFPKNKPNSINQYPGGDGNPIGFHERNYRNPNQMINYFATSYPKPCLCSSTNDLMNMSVYDLYHGNITNTNICGQRCGSFAPMNNPSCCTPSNVSLICNCQKSYYSGLNLMMENGVLNQPSCSGQVLNTCGCTTHNCYPTSVCSLPQNTNMFGGNSNGNCNGNCNCNAERRLL